MNNYDTILNSHIDFMNTAYTILLIIVFVWFVWAVIANTFLWMDALSPRNSKTIMFMLISMVCVIIFLSGYYIKYMADDVVSYKMNAEQIFELCEEEGLDPYLVVDECNMAITKGERISFFEIYQIGRDKKGGE